MSDYIEAAARLLSTHFGIEYEPDAEMYDAAYWNSLASETIQAADEARGMEWEEDERERRRLVGRWEPIP